MSESKAIQAWNLTPTSLGEAMKFGEMLAVSGLVPQIFINNPAGVVAACEQGSHLGFTAMQSLQSIAVINGMPCLWGDALPALAMGHSKFVSIDETYDPNTMVASCTVEREGMKPQTREFSWADAERAQLTGKDTYKKYPQRMLKARARAWAIRDVFPDALKGTQVVEEVRDIPENAATDDDYRQVVATGEARVVEPEIDEAKSGMDALDAALDGASEQVGKFEAETADWKAKMDDCLTAAELERVGHEMFDMDEGTAKALLRTYYANRLKLLSRPGPKVVQPEDGEPEDGTVIESDETEAAPAGDSPDGE